MTSLKSLRQYGIPLALLGLMTGCGPTPTPAPEVRVYREVGDFTLTKQDGQPLSAAALQGKVWVANFVFTSCTAECIVLSKRMSNLEKRFAENSDVAFVSFTVDPGTDTPERLEKYAKLYDAGDQWAFLTGNRGELETIIKDKFLLPVAQTSEEATALQQATLIHSDRFAIVDRKGVVRAYVHGMDPAAETHAMQIIERLLAE